MAEDPGSTFFVRTTPHFERLMKRLVKQHRDLVAIFADAVVALRGDPYNRARKHAIKKLEGVAAGEGAWRLRSGRFRFRYDIDGNEVVLHHCGLRREDTYR